MFGAAHASWWIATVRVAYTRPRIVTGSPGLRATVMGSQSAFFTGHAGRQGHCGFDIHRSLGQVKGPVGITISHDELLETVLRFELCRAQVNFHPAAVVLSIGVQVDGNCLDEIIQNYCKF